MNTLLKVLAKTPYMDYVEIIDRLGDPPLLIIKQLNSMMSKGNVAVVDIDRRLKYYLTPNGRKFMETLN